MKNIISKVGFFAAILSLSISCEKSVRIDLPAPEDKMLLKASKESVEVSFFSTEQSAISFSWNNSGYASEGRTVQYHFKMDISGNNFENLWIAFYNHVLCLLCHFLRGAAGYGSKSHNDRKEFDTLFHFV